MRWRQADGRDLLYIARDISVSQLALPHLRDAATKRRVIFTRDQFGQNRALPDLLRDTITPYAGQP
jgi:cell filamentation protein